MLCHIHTLYFGEPVGLVVVLWCTQSCVEKYQNQHQPIKRHRFYRFSAGSPNATVPSAPRATDDKHEHTKHTQTNMYAQRNTQLLSIALIKDKGC